jgi:hypothetical protein
MAITLLAVLGGGLAGLLLLHTWAAQDGFRLASLQQQQARLATRIQALTARDQRLESPDRLQAAATALGMRPTGDPRFVRLSSGKLVGKAVAVPAPPPPAPESLSPAAQAQAQVRGHARARQGGRAAPPAGRSADPQVGGKARASRRAQPGGTQSARSHPRHTG